MSRKPVHIAASFLAVGLIGVSLGACSTYGNSGYGSYGRAYPSYGHSPYGRGVGTPYGYDRGHYSGSGVSRDRHDAPRYFGGRRY
jgi:hypothetical protein